MWRRLTLILTLAALAGIILILLEPVYMKVLQVALLGCLVGLWLGITVLAWKRKPWRIAGLILPILRETWR